MECLVISGMSGAGKSLAADVLEDLGYYCIDNMPAPLIPRFVDLFMDNPSKYDRTAFVVDARGDNDYKELFSVLEMLRAFGVDSKILFLDCSADILINRHKESRRRHPLDAVGKGMSTALTEERELLAEVRDRADYVIDTTVLSPAELKLQIISLFAEDAQETLVTSIVSFGFKHGVPLEAEIILDTRFIQNPHYVDALRPKTGLDPDVSNYVFSDQTALEFTEKAVDMLGFLISHYIKQGKMSLVVGIGCTGGKHRSVAVGERVASELRKHGHTVAVNHRDLMKGQS